MTECSLDLKMDIWPHDPLIGDVHGLPGRPYYYLLFSVSSSCSSDIMTFFFFTFTPPLLLSICSPTKSHSVTARIPCSVFTIVVL